MNKKNLTEQVYVLTTNQQMGLSYEKYNDLYLTRANIQVLNYDKQLFIITMPIPSYMININDIVGIKWQNNEYKIYSQIKTLSKLLQFTIQKTGRFW